MADGQRLELGERGLREAHERLQRRVTDGDDPLVPLGEMLAWAYAVEAWYGADERGTARQRAYRNARNEDDDGQVAAGFRYARNRVTHQLGLVGGLVDGIVFPMRFPMTFAPTWRWASGRQLAALSGRDPDLRPYYDQHLAGHMLTHPLPAVVRWLTEGVKGCDLPPPP